MSHPLRRAVAVPTVFAALALSSAPAIPAASSGAAQEHVPSHPRTPTEPAVSCPAIPGEAGEPIAVVRYLADDALRGRSAGSSGARCAGEYIAAQFEALGLEPAGENGWFQSLPLASATNPHAPAGTGRNVLALLPGADARLASSHVIVGAHYDHLGLGEFGSTGKTGEIHNGADDNASGVAAMLEAARLLAEGPRPARSVLFIAFTGEEMGLIGSSYYTKNPTRALEEAVAMLNLDMVGRLEADPLIVYGTGTAPEWEEIIPTANAEPAIELAYEPSGFGPSDHTSFYASEIPVLHLFSNVHRDYHRETDDWEKIDVPGLMRIARLTTNLARSLAERPTELTLIPNVGERGERAGGYGAWLGTVPDFTPVDHGVLLAGVTEGSPAHAAGLQKGDVLVGLGGMEIGDLQAMTDALRAHRPGDVVTLEYLRSGEHRTAEATLGDRSDRPE